jgi:hypothetical protein
MAVSRREAFMIMVGALASPVTRLGARGRLSLHEVVARHTAARGGATAIDTIHSERAEIAIEEKESRYDALYQCGREPFWRIDVYVRGKHVFCEGLDSDGPWIWPEDQAQAKEAAADAKRTGLQGIEFNLYGLHRFEERGHQLQLMDEESVEGVRYHIVRVEMSDSYETFLYINPQTWLIDRRRDLRAFHPDLDSTKRYIDKKYSDYQSVSGVLTAFKEEQFDLRSGTRVNESTVKAMTYNHLYSVASTSRSFRPA